MSECLRRGGDFNRLSVDKMLALSKLEACADDKSNQAQIQISFSGGWVGPTENALVLLYDTLISGFQWM